MEAKLGACLDQSLPKVIWQKPPSPDLLSFKDAVDLGEVSLEEEHVLVQGTPIVKFPHDLTKYWH